MALLTIACDWRLGIGEFLPLSLRDEENRAAAYIPA
jgi:hypothetical protein